MIKRISMISLLAVSMVFSLASCNQASSSASEAPESSSASVENSSESSKSEEASSAPVASTEVNVYMPSPAGLQKNIEAGFEKANPGIDMKVTSGTTGELEAKIESEKANPVCDVLILASWSDGISYMAQGGLQAYVPANADKVADPFKESSNQIWGTSASAVGIIYNTDNVKKEDIEKLDWADFGDSTKWSATEHPFSIPDPSLSGAAKDFVAGLVSSNPDNQKILDSWVSNGIQNGGKNGPAIQAVEQGKVDVLVGGVDYNAYSDKKKGNPIDIYYPASGTVVNARPAMIMKTAPHLDAAKKVMDYLLSDDGQAAVAKAELIPGRTDVAAASDRLGYADIKSLPNLDWTEMSKTGSDIAKKFVDAIANRK